MAPLSWYPHQFPRPGRPHTHGHGACSAYGQTRREGHHRDVYAAAGGCLIVLAVAAGAPLGGFARESWLMLLALALGPQLLGHSSFNWALKYLSATLIALAILGEPIGSTILAWALLHEPVDGVKLVGMALLFAGIFLAARAGERR